MNNLIQADIFFFTSTILLTVLSVVFVVALVSVMKLVREARGIVALVRKESENIAGDIETLRKNIRDNGLSPGGLVSSAIGAFRNNKKSRKGKGRSA